MDSLLSDFSAVPFAPQPWKGGGTRLLKHALSRSVFDEGTAATGGGRYVFQRSAGALWMMLCAVLLVAASGCQNPRREARQAVRTGQWEGFLARYADMEADRPERLEALRILHEEYEAHRSKTLEKTLKRIEKAHHKKKHAWVKAQPLRRKELEAVMKGNPDNIPRVWDQLVK